MSDSLLSPAVGGLFWAAAAALIARCAKRVRETADSGLLPLMGVLGAFVFTAQMINFAIPGTGSSGHLGGGLLLAILLGPHAALLVIASVLVVQAFFFADGGLLALGCNIVNLGLFPAFVAYPFIYRFLAAPAPTSRRAWVGTILSAVVGLQLGALGVVVQTRLSGVSDLSFQAFTALMLPIHLAIGFVEGLVTVAVVAVVAHARPDILKQVGRCREGGGTRDASWRPVWIGLLVAAALIGGTLSWFASARPDGLEWSLAGSSRQADAGAGLPTQASFQSRLAILPDYGFREPDDGAGAGETAAAAPPWPAVEIGSSVSGLLGGGVTLALVTVAGWLLVRLRRHANIGNSPARPES